MDNLSEAIARVRERMEAAAARSHRNPADIALLAVTKIFPASVIRAAYEHGLRAFGENYVQEFDGKEPELRGLSGAQYHLIGHLQSNKARRAAELFQVVQTVDSAKIAQRINASGHKLEIMIEVKLSREESKWGVAEHDLAKVVEAARQCPNIALTGLMTVPEWSEDAEQSRPVFARLREIAAQHGLPKLSMGMSNDFEVAIEEGSTIVRVGTALFGRRKRA